MPLPARGVALAAGAGYLAGSISLTRLVTRRLVDRADLEGATIIDGDALTLTRVSPSRVGALAGTRWGVVTAVAEIAKVAAVTWLCRRRWPSGGGEAAMTGAVIGHVLPVFHRFRGGYGQSPIVGGMAVLDPLAVPAAGVVSSVAGVAVGDEWVIQDGWPPALILWALWRRDRALLAATIAVNAVYLAAEVPELRRHVRSRRAEGLPWAERVRSIPGRMGGERRVG